MGIFFTMFISWIKFPAKQSASPPGLVPDKVVDVASFQMTAGALDFNWGENTGGRGGLGGRGESGGPEGGGLGAGGGGALDFNWGENTCGWGAWGKGGREDGRGGGAARGQWGWGAD